MAFIQDAFVRDVNAKDVAAGPDLATLDKAALTTRLVSDARHIVGAAKVASIAFTQMQFSPLHPKSTTEDAIPPSQRNQPPAVAQTPAAQLPAAAPGKTKTP
jgi:hypothetical protein